MNRHYGTGVSLLFRVALALFVITQDKILAATSAFQVAAANINVLGSWPPAEMGTSLAAHQSCGMLPTEIAATGLLFAAIRNSNPLHFTEFLFRSRRGSCYRNHAVL